MNDLIITISRQNGSGGRAVGKIIAQMLDVRCYDQEIIAKTAELAGVSMSDVKKNTSVPAKSDITGALPSTDPMFQAQSQAIRDIAALGSCVLVGRCADYVLRGRPNVVNVFIHAPIGKRVENSKQRNGFSDKIAYDTVTSKDKKRAEYYHHYTGRDWGSLSNYHLTINTGLIDPEDAAKLIVDYVNMRNPRNI